MRTFFAFIALAAALAMPAAAQDTRRSESVSIALGETVTLRVDAGAPGGFVVVDRNTSGEITPTELQMAIDLSHAPPEEASGVNSRVVEAPEGQRLNPPAPDLVRIRFTRLPGPEPQVLLLLENGYHQAFAYRALQHVAGDATATDVCWVLPGRVNFEHWPYQIDSLDLSGIRLYPWTDMNAQAPCQ